MKQFRTIVTVGVMSIAWLFSSQAAAQENSCREVLRTALLMEHFDAQAEDAFLYYKMEIVFEPVTGGNAMPYYKDIFSVLQQGDRRFFQSAQTEVFEDREVKIYVDRGERTIYLMSPPPAKNRDVAVENYLQVQQELVNLGKVHSCRTETAPNGDALQYVQLSLNSPGLASYGAYERVEYQLRNGQLESCQAHLRPGGGYSKVSLRFLEVILEPNRTYSNQRSAEQMVFQGKRLRKEYEGFAVKDLRTGVLEEYNASTTE